MDKQMIEETIKEMFIKDKIQIVVGDINWRYWDSDGNLIVMITNVEEDKKPNLM